ncbi:hypothetical protein SERLA73DRAFT_119022 [Serpula lacrymans var. lacrymans S7.3]|uniref:GS catalytic domain-containing protein n=2 Tax=Serpula lacrymans var. lacrymans TaxID=341189 RepID=F8PJ37_SERL3|nr:uncharacterized protein SERLADRAFT_432989 [Serpula lacrymans var. lacrymans S7.9]EGO03198.1 hypothetical protein SERLA73DRAFT_119022 [Serpula lacrymans var. lacrymans S7.3]EGO28976.1 hypothetical protein SERLADRAFT_432989 [Serpula lacrymans var. lacrymans S7.9]
MSLDYGVKYTPSTVSAGNISISDLNTYGIKHVRIQWVDLINNVRYRVVTLSHFNKLLKSSRPSISVTKCVFGLVFLALAPGFNAVGEYLYVIEISTLRLCSYAPGHAVVMGRFEEKVPIMSPSHSLSVQVPLCPRTTLRRVTEDAKRTLGVEFLVGFETEFILLKSTNPIVAVNNHGWSNSAALGAGTVESKVLEEISDALVASGIEVQMYHAEAAPGQYELVTGPLPPLEAADALIHKRETIFNIASKHGLRATLAPRLYKDSCGSAAHAHISVHSTPGRSNGELSQSVENALTSIESSFLAGLLSHLPSVTAFTLPLPASYSRMLDGVWSGGTYVCWGTDNREAPIRLCNASSLSSRNFEVKCIDGTSNPYLVLASLLSAGLSGVKDSQKLDVKDLSDTKSAAQLDESERRAIGITQRMSLSWEEARHNLAKDSVIKEYMGQAMVNSYLDVNEILARMMEAETEAKKVQLLVENY